MPNLPLANAMNRRVIELATRGQSLPSEAARATMQAIALAALDVQAALSAEWPVLVTIHRPIASPDGPLHDEGVYGQ